MLEYTLVDYDSEMDGDEVEWARRLHEQGWRCWHDTGVWITLNGRRVKRWSVRRRKPQQGPESLTASPKPDMAGSPDH